MATTYKVLGQRSPTAANLDTLYTVPASTSAVVSSIVVANRSATATTFRIAVRVAGAAISNEDYLVYDAPIAGNSTVSFTLGVTLAATDVISTYAGAATLSFSAFGSEIV